MRPHQRFAHEISLLGLVLLNLGLVGCGLPTAAAGVPPPSHPQPACAPNELQPAPTIQPGRWEVTFCNGDLPLHGWLYKPQGNGPFKTVLYNHGSEKDPRTYLDAFSRVFLARGYAFMAPFRRGHADSPGPYIEDQLRAADRSAAPTLLVSLQEEQLGDQLAGYAVLQNVAFVDHQRVVVTGVSYGGIQTILGAEANPGYRAAVDCAGAAQTWKFSPPLQQRLTSAVANIAIPTFLLQAANDYDTAPSTTLAAEFERLGKPYRVQIYPSFGTGAIGAEGHSFCGTRGASQWSPDVFDFIRAALT
ncbi:MAG TPA: prolyl oligopeptidase family serine peptidase [Chloroflexota bacterium]|nr:prolyl oligopeptidase family serine peptidase [Chloroflexota bacterium]